MEKKIFIPKTFSEDAFFAENLDYENIEDQELIEDARNFVIQQTELCFDSCVDLSQIYFQNYEKNCLNKCIESNYKAFSNYFKNND